MNLSNQLLKILLAMAVGSSAYAQVFDSFLENPPAGSTESGISLVSGWHCNAERIDLQIDGGRLIPVPYGSERRDTEGICGDADNGFGFLLNYSELGDGEHTITTYADGVAFGTSTFTVNTLGTGFVQGVAARTTSDILLQDSVQRVQLRWDEAKQNFVIASVVDLGYSPSDLLGAILGPWSGEWTATDSAATGSVDLEIGVSPDGSAFGIVDLTITGTSCAAALVGSSPIDPSAPVAEVLVNFADGSAIVFQGIPAPSFRAFGGSFIYVAGPCQGQEGMFQVFR